MDRMRRTRAGSALILAVPLAAAPAMAQQPADTVVITPGAHYRAGGLHTLFFGRHYRELWTTPIRVERLDLDRFAGGLRPPAKAAASRRTRCASRGRTGLA